MIIEALKKIRILLTIFITRDNYLNIVNKK